LHGLAVVYYRRASNEIAPPVAPHANVTGEVESQNEY